MLTSVKEEVRRNPIAAISGGASAVVGLVSLVVALAQQKASTAVSSGAVAAGMGPDEFRPDNVFLLLAFFFGATVFVAVLVRLIAKKNDIAALFVSILLLALSNFCTLLLAYAIPPRPVSRELFTALDNMVHWGSIFIVLAICGQAVLMDLVKSGAASKTSDAEKLDAAKSSLVFGLVILFAWGIGIAAVQKRIVVALLPQTAHPLYDLKVETSQNSSQAEVAASGASR